MAAYYHGAKLARNPLCELLAAATTEALSDLAAMRALLREALESLRPPSHTPADDPSWLPYRVATLHYLQSQPRGIICEELGISQTTFYRHRERALDEMADYLWRHRVVGPRHRFEGATSGGDALARAVSAVIGQYSESLDLAEVAAGVQAILARMVGTRGTTLRVDVAPSSELIYGDPVLLRQVILNLATDALRSVPGQTIALQLLIAAGTVRGTIMPFPQALHIESADSGVAVARQLIEAVGGQLSLHGTPPRVEFQLPLSRPPLVLCLDDDPDASRLYGLYLSGEGYRVRGVTTSEQLRAALEDELPSVILLDILMPREDGWAILDGLQQDARTEDVPVVICSVLQQPDLALGMGAAAVLTKPVTPDALRRTLKEVLGNSSAAETAS